MKKTKKIVSIFMAAVIALTVLVFTVSADSIEDTSQDIASGKEISMTLPNRYYAAYKIVAAEDGTVTVDFTAKIEYLYFYLYDSNGHAVGSTSIDVTSGSINGGGQGRDYVYFNWNSIIEKTVASVSWNVNKGTYYLKLDRSAYSDGGSGETTFTVNYPSADSDSSGGKISYITIKIPVGTQLEFGAIVTPDEADVTWKSSKKSVATVSESGIVTAQKTGTATISAQSGSSKKSVKVIVTDSQTETITSSFSDDK